MVVANLLSAAMNAPTGRNSDSVELLVAFHADHPNAHGALCMNALDLLERFSDAAVHAAIAAAWERSPDSQQAWKNCVEMIRDMLHFSEANGDVYAGL